MFGLSLSRRDARNGQCVIAQLNARLQPLDRGDIFEDPLDDTLQNTGLGEVTGGGTLQAREGWIRQCDIEMDLPAADAETLRKIAGHLEALGAPKGSKLLVEETGTEVPFGTSEGLAIYLNGTDLEDSVYQSCDVNYVIAELDRLLVSSRPRRLWEPCCWPMPGSPSAKIARIWHFLYSSKNFISQRSEYISSESIRKTTDLTRNCE